MNTLEFAASMNKSGFESFFMEYFDQIMSLYGIIAEYNIKSISNDGTKAEFIIKCPIKKDTNIVYEAIPNTVSKYDRTFNIDKSVYRNTITINMIEVI